MAISEMTFSNSSSSVELPGFLGRPRLSSSFPHNFSLFEGPFPPLLFFLSFLTSFVSRCFFLDLRFFLQIKCLFFLFLVVFRRHQSHVMFPTESCSVLFAFLKSLHTLHTSCWTGCSFLVQSFKEILQYCDEWRKFTSVSRSAVSQSVIV